VWLSWLSSKKIRTSRKQCKNANLWTMTFNLQVRFGNKCFMTCRLHIFIKVLKAYFRDFNIVTYEGFSWLKVTGFELDDWIYWYFFYYNYTYLQSIITAHNQWKPKTRSTPYWTTSIFPSAVIDFILIYESLRTNDERRMNLTVRFRVTLRLADHRQSICLGDSPLRPTSRNFVFYWTLAVIPLM
jgi:hypothetical protein